MSTLSVHDANYRPFDGFQVWTGTRIAKDVWDRYYYRLQTTRESVQTATDPQFELNRSLLAAAVNTGAIEGLHNADRGLTLTAIEHAIDWGQYVRRAEGEEAEAHVRAGLEAFDLALDVATKKQEISEALIRHLHEVACAAQETVTVTTSVGVQEQTLLKGQYKTLPNHVLQADGSIHAYCPVDSVPVQMARLVNELRSPVFLDGHPVLQAAFAHHALTNIHPFQDGNGRVARVLSSVYLLRTASIPLVIYPDQTVGYFGSLEEADRGEHRPFVDFIFDRAVDMLAFTADMISGDGPLEAVLPMTRVPPSAVEAGTRLSDLIDRELRQQVADVVVSDGVEIGVETMGFSHGARDQIGRRTILHTHPMVRVSVRQYGLDINRWFPVFASLDASAHFPVAIEVDARDDMLEFRLDELHPEVTTAAMLKLGAFLRRVLADLLNQLEAELDKR